MEISNLIRTIYESLLVFVPLFRAIWLGTIALGIVMIVIALLLKKNTQRKKAPWVVGAIGLLMTISSGTQLIASMF